MNERMKELNNLTEEGEVTIWLTNGFKFHCRINKIRGEFLEIDDLKDKIYRLISINAISNIELNEKERKNEDKRVT